MLRELGTEHSPLREKPAESPPELCRPLCTQLNQLWHASGSADPLTLPALRAADGRTDEAYGLEAITKAQRGAAHQLGGPGVICSAVPVECSDLGSVQGPLLAGCAVSP